MLYRKFKSIQHLQISYGYTELNKSSDAYISNYALDNLKHKFTLDLGILLPANFYMDIKSTWQDRNGSYAQYVTPDALPVETPYAPYFLLDIHAGLKVRSVTLFAETTNIFQASYRDIGSVTMPGRWIKAGVKWRL